MKSMLRYLVALLSAVVWNTGAASGLHSYVPPEGFVPDEVTAISIAEAIWKPIYGEDAIRRQQPIKATLANGIWTVVGTLPEGTKGGVAVAEIARRDARVIRVSHGK